MALEPTIVKYITPCEFRSHLAVLSLIRPTMRPLLDDGCKCGINLEFKILKVLQV